MREEFGPKEFEVDLLRLFRINDKTIIEMTLETPIDFDSLTRTELCILIEEYFDIPTEYQVAKAFKTVGDLYRYIIENKNDREFNPCST